MLTMQKSIDRLNWNTEHHFLHIKAAHPFIRQWAVQFELGYSDARLIQYYLETQGNMELWQAFTDAYEAVYNYEYAFVAGGIEGYQEQFGTDTSDYEKAHDELLSVLKRVSDATK
jgi:hypothetical protein